MFDRNGLYPFIPVQSHCLGFHTGTETLHCILVWTSGGGSLGIPCCVYGGIPTQPPVRGDPSPGQVAMLKCFWYMEVTSCRRSWGVFSYQRETCTSVQLFLVCFFPVLCISSYSHFRNILDKGPVKLHQTAMEALRVSCGCCNELLKGGRGGRGAWGVGLKQQKCVSSQLWRQKSEVKVLASCEGEGTLDFLRLLSGGRWPPWWSLSCGCLTPISASLCMWLSPVFL